MANNEKLQHKQEVETSSAELEAIRDTQRERLREEHEKAEKSPEESIEKVKQEALEKANSVEKLQKSPEKASVERKKTGAVPKKVRDASFKQTMKHTQSQMSVPSRAFSKFIHNKTVERVSGAIGSTVARPNAILSGSVFAFLFTLGIFLLARHSGYPLSGTETIASFAIGWMVGLLFDYLRLEIRGGQ